MKSKKLISLLCAAAMTTSAFAGLVTTASAATENDILWSDTFNNAATGVFLDGTAGLDGNKNAIENSTAVNGLKFVTTNRDRGDAAGYTDSNEEYVYNGSYYAINEKEDAADKYVRMGFPVFGDFAKNGRWAYVSLGEGYAATAEKDVIMDFDLKLTSGLDKGEIDPTEGLKPVLRVGSFDATAKTANAVEIKGKVTGDDWVDARIIVSDSTGAKLYINGEEVTDAANAAVKTLNTIGLYSADGQTCGKAMADLVGNSSYDKDGTLNDATKKTLTPTADIDNVIIYNETAGVADGTSQAPGAQDQEGGTTPPPPPTEKVIPAVDMTLQAPENATNVQSYTFDDKALKKWSLGTEDIDDSTTIPGLNVHVGARDKGGTVATYAAVVGLSQGKALQMTADQYSTAGRTPRINFTTGLPIDASTNLSTALTFNVYLSAVEGKEDIAKPRLYFLKDTAQTGDDGAGGFRNVAAVLTASEGDVLYRGDDAASNVISAYITPNEWHKVTMVITPSSTGSTYRVYIDDDYDNATLSLQYIATGDNATSMSDLPYIAVEGQAAKVGGVDTTPTYGVATIDNIVAYQGVVENPKQMLPVVAEAPTPAPPTATPQPKHNVTVAYDGTDKATVSTTETEAFDAVMAIAKYDSEGVLLSLDVKDVKGISSAAGVEVAVGAMNNGDQLMVWNSLEDMIPYGSLVVSNGGAQPVAITGTVEVSGTAKVGETLTAVVSGLNEGATAKYEWQANTGADGAYEKIADATASTFVVTEDLVGKTIKVVVTADGYTGSIASVPTAAVEEADEEPVAAPTVETATLHDTSEAVQDEDLYTAGSYKVTTTDETGYTNVAIAAENLKKHQNGDTPATAGYWVGAKVTAPEGKTIEGYYFSKDAYVEGTSTFTDTAADDKETIEFYTNVGAVDQKVWAAVKLSDESIYVYKLDTTDVDCYIPAPTVETATLHDTSEAVQDEDLYTAGSYKVTTTAETGYTKVAIAAENLKKHQNGDSPATAGYWVGAKVTAPADTKITGYYFSKDAYEEGTSQFTECDENEISFYTNAGAADQKIWAAVKLSDESIYVYKLDTTGVKIVEEAVPYDENTVTFDEGGDSAIFVDFSRVTSSIETSTTATANTTKVNRVATGTGGPSGARYDKYSDAYKATGDNVEVSFDFTVPTRDAYVSVRGTSADTSDRNNDAAERIFTIGCESSFTLKIWGADTTAIEVANTSADTNWYHVEAVVNNTAKTTSIKVYNYKANNNYENETPLYENAALGFRDNSVTGVVGMDYFSPTNNAIMELDNVKIYDATYVAPMDVNVTAPDKGDGTLKVDKTQVKAEDVITITATPVAGKKVTAVKVNGEAVTYNDGYKYTVTGDEDAIVVTAEFARADAATVEVAGASSVQQGETAQYTATIKDEAGTVLTGDITWSVEGAQDTSNTKIENGLLTVGADETASTLTVKATTKKDVANEEDETTVEGIATVTVATEAVYNVTKGAETNGTFTVSAAQATEGTEITVVPSPAEGYRVKEVSYSKTEDGTEKQVVTDDSGYKFDAPAYNVTVNVEFEAISYTITDATVEENGNSVAIKVDGQEAAKATIGQTVTIEPTVAQGYKVNTVTVMNGLETVEVSNNTFTMPAGDVTVTVTFVAWNGVYSSITFDNDADLTALGTWSDKTGRSTTNTISDGAFKMSIASDNKRSKGYSTMETPIDFSDSTNATISFDMIMNPMGNASKPTVSEITIGNSDHYALFAIRADSENTAAGFSVYAGGKVNNNVSSGSDAGSIGTSKNNWGSNEYVWNISNASGPAMTVLQKADESALSFTKGTLYNVVLSISGDTMTVTVTDSTNGENTATAELNIAGLTKDIKHFVGFLDQGSSVGSGSYITVDNFKVVDTDVYSAE